MHLELACSTLELAVPAGRLHVPLLADALAEAGNLVDRTGVAVSLRIYQLVFLARVHAERALDGLPRRTPARHSVEGEGAGASRAKTVEQERSGDA